jgi:hypothetical protein
VIGTASAVPGSAPHRLACVVVTRLTGGRSEVVQLRHGPGSLMDLDPVQVRGRYSLAMGNVMMVVDAYDGVVTIEFSHYTTGERAALPVRLRLAGTDDSGEVIDRRLPAVEPDPF